MLSSIAHIARRCGLAALLMIAIFLASSVPETHIPDFGGWDGLVKKGGHLLAYAALALAYVRGLAYGRVASSRHMVMAAILAGLYAATDEYHQSFVAGRGAALVDVLIDIAGAALGLVLRASVTRPDTSSL